MRSFELISRRFQELSELPEKREFIYLNHIRKEFRPDLQHFIIGETLILRDGRPVIGKNLYANWLKKIRTRGFDYDIRFR